VVWPRAPARFGVDFKRAAAAIQGVVRPGTAPATAPPRRCRWGQTPPTDCSVSPDATRRRGLTPFLPTQAAPQRRGQAPPLREKPTTRWAASDPGAIMHHPSSPRPWRGRHCQSRSHTKQGHASTASPTSLRPSLQPSSPPSSQQASQQASPSPSATPGTRPAETHAGPTSRSPRNPDLAG